VNTMKGQPPRHLFKEPSYIKDALDREEDRQFNDRNPYYRAQAIYHVNAPLRENKKAMVWILKHVFTPSEYAKNVYYSREGMGDGSYPAYDVSATYVDIIKINALEHMFSRNLGWGMISDGYYDQHKYDHTDEEWEWAKEWALETILKAEKSSKPAPRGPDF